MVPALNNSKNKKIKNQKILCLTVILMYSRFNLNNQIIYVALYRAVFRSLAIKGTCFTVAVYLSIIISYTGINCKIG
jgi:hypothetical protein